MQGGDMKKVYGLIGVMIILFMMTACADKQPENKPNDDQSNETANYYPFTGLPADTEVDQRAIAVMISNSEQARPQTGLSKADIVFEMLAEGNITRFMAVFQSTIPDVVGPVRSAREYFFTLADHYDALYVFSGAADSVNEKLAAREMDYLKDIKYDGEANLFVREPFRKAPHNLYLQFGILDQVAETKGFQTTETYEPMSFLKETDTLPQDVSYTDGSYAKVDLLGSKPVIEFDYHDETGMYTRTQQGEESIELESEKPLEIANVFIVESPHEVMDKEGRRAIDVDAGGKAFLLQKGQAQELTWENQEGRIVPVYNGEVVPFVPGKTWIIFVPNESDSNGKEKVKIGK